MLKAEAQAQEPDLRLSFSRPGLVTFKAERTRPIPRFTFARVSGRFLGKGDRLAAEQAIVAQLSETVVHRFCLADQQGSGRPAAVGERVLDVVQLDAEAFWWGERTVGPWDWGVPGGAPALVLPDVAPSRAWLKLEEMLLWSRWQPPADLVALELGSAPGGASWALLNRGARVVGVDVAPMAALCIEHPKFTHLKLSVRDLRKKHLPERIDALFCDLGLKPVEAVPQIRHLCQIFPSIQRLYYTLKLGDGQRPAELDHWRDALRRLGFEIHSTHLPSNRREVLVVGLKNATLGA